MVARKDLMLSAIVMAAGRGTRMRSEMPKPLHEVAGRSMLHWVLAALDDCGAGHQVVVVGHGGQEVIAHVADVMPGLAVSFVEQQTQRGTGDAASVGVTGLPDDPDDTNDVVILPGDTPLLTAATLRSFVDFHRSELSVCTLLSATLDDPTGYGRVIRNSAGVVERVVEQADGTDEELAVTEVNTSIYCFKQNLLAPALRRITPNNAQGEYYLTDIIGVLRETGHPVRAWSVDDPGEVHGVNDREHLASAGAVLRSRITSDHLRSGVGIIDPASTWIDADVSIEPDARIEPGTVLRGATTIAAGAIVGPHSTVEDCTIGSGAVVPHTVAHGVDIAEGTNVAPFSVLS